MQSLSLKVFADFSSGSAKSWPRRRRSRDINKTVGIVACASEKNGERSGGDKSLMGSFLSRSQTYALLKQQMEVAAKSEDYKEAARIRDSLRSFEEEEPVLRLRRLMKKAIEEEKFEDAAKYRDELKQLTPHALVKCSSDATTLGIRVQVRSAYIEGQSQPLKGQYFFSYQIRIINNSDRPVQLLRRHWIITDANGKTENIWGLGVIGEQPVILPRTGFEYSSACPLVTPNGRMWLRLKDQNGPTGCRRIACHLQTLFSMVSVFLSVPVIRLLISQAKQLREAMAAVSGVGLSWGSKVSPLRSSNPSSRRRVCSKVRMTLSVDEKKFTLQKSEEIFNAAKDLMPGGVNSPVRAFKSVGGQPIVFDSVKGSHAWDVDGNEYIDYVGSWGPAIIGHADDEVIAALSETLKKGTSFGAPCLLENVLAEMVISAVPSIEMVRFVNSGTEACMAVLRLARAFTGREKIIKFEGCYHGHADPFLVKAGSGVATLGLPDSPGVPKAATYETLISPYNDIATVENLFEANKGEISAVILEPVVGNAGFITPKLDFLHALRKITKDNGSLLIFDEVMTGFRLAYGGAQEYFGITPDLTTLGKIIGGGLPVGAYGGRRDIMEMVAPAGPMYQAGTLSGNPLAMTAGIHTVKRIKQPGTYEYLDKITKELIDGILEAGKSAGHAMCGGYISGMFGFFFTEGPVYNFTDAKKSDTAKFGRFHRGMLEQGVYLAPSQFEAGFTSLAHTMEDIEQTIAAADTVFRKM